jgi:hypothetical protein
MKLSNDINISKYIIRKSLGIGKNIIGKDILVKGKQIYLVYINSYIQNEIIYEMVDLLNDLDVNYINCFYLKRLIQNNVYYTYTECFDDINELQRGMLNGEVAVIIDGEYEGILVKLNHNKNNSLSEGMYSPLSDVHSLRIYN